MYYVIVNAFSGNGRGLASWKLVRAELDRLRLPYTAWVCETAEQSGERIRSIDVSVSNPVVLLIGGDGTVHSALEAAVERGCVLGVLPGGTGNDFVRSLRMPLDPVQALHAILASRVRRIDILKTNGALSSNVVSAGIDACVAREAGRSRWKNTLNRWGLGRLIYALTLIRVLATYKPTDVTIEFDGADAIRFDRTWLVATGNMPYYGGGMLICPGAREDDGAADVCVVSGIGRLKLLACFPLIYGGNHKKKPGVSFYRAKSLRIRSDAPVPVQAEGEMLGDTPVDVSVLPGALLAFKPEYQ